MADILDVAAYILEKKGPMTAMKLQKLAYYSQAWSLVWDERPIFEEEFQAWANGPVSPFLYKHHKGDFLVEKIPGKPEVLTEAERETVDAVLGYYGDRGASWLSNLTHLEAPWKDARGNLKPGARCSEVITPVAMNEYYGGLT